MKALVRHVYGSPEVLHVEEAPMPPTGDGDLLVKVHAASERRRLACAARDTAPVSPARKVSRLSTQSTRC